MSNETLYLQQGLLTPKAAILYKWAGWMIVGICLLHFVFWSIISWHSWGTWASGTLWGHADPQTLIEFELNFEFGRYPAVLWCPCYCWG